MNYVIYSKSYWSNPKKKSDYQGHGLGKQPKYCKKEERSDNVYVKHLVMQNMFVPTSGVSIVARVLWTLTHAR